MNPVDVHPNDWPLYFDGTYMSHAELGLVQISCSNEAFSVRVRGNESYTVVEPKTLTPIWPIARAINLEGHAAYISRRARREARRSATAAHYFIQWSMRWSGVSHTIMAQLYKHDPYPSPENALCSLRDKTRQSIAVSRDLILVRHPNKHIGVICRGNEAGLLQEDNGRFEFIPEVPESPVARRVQFKLQKEGILCLSI